MLARDVVAHVALAPIHHGVIRIESPIFTHNIPLLVRIVPPRLEPRLGCPRVGQRRLDFDLELFTLTRGRGVVGKLDLIIGDLDDVEVAQLSLYVGARLDNRCKLSITRNTQQEAHATHQ